MLKSIKDLSREAGVEDIDQNDSSVDLSNKNDTWLPKSETFWLSQIYIHISDTDDKYRKYRLNWLQRIFVTLEHPQSSTLGDILAIFQGFVIIFSIIATVISTLPVYQKVPSDCSNPVCENTLECPNQKICEPQSSINFYYIQVGCVIVFFIDSSLRIILSGTVPTRLSGTIPNDWDEQEKARAFLHGEEPELEPYYSALEQCLRYTFSVRTLVDLLSFLPIVILHNSSNDNISFLRFLLVLRVYRLLEINSRGRLLVKLFKDTLFVSREAITMYFIFLGIFILFFASIMYSAEKGSYLPNENGYFEYMRPNASGGLTPSPFDSITTSIYFIIITVMTVGYGDISPTSIPGRAIASICAVLSVLVIALPITIIGNNFTAKYEEYLVRLDQAERVMSEKRNTMTKKLFKKAKKLKAMEQNTMKKATGKIAKIVNHAALKMGISAKCSFQTSVPDTPDVEQQPSPNFTFEDDEEPHVPVQCTLPPAKRPLEIILSSRDLDYSNFNDGENIANTTNEFHNNQRDADDFKRPNYLKREPFNVYRTIFPSVKKSFTDILEWQKSARAAIEIGNIHDEEPALKYDTSFSLPTTGEHSHRQINPNTIENIDTIIGLSDNYLHSLDKEQLLVLFRQVRSAYVNRNVNVKQQLKGLLNSIK